MAKENKKPITPKGLREAMGYSLKQVGQGIGVSTSTVAGWESGRRVPSAAQLSKLAGFLNLSPEVTGKLLKWFEVSK